MLPVLRFCPGRWQTLNTTIKDYSQLTDKLTVYENVRIGKEGEMTFGTLEMDEILSLMATDLDNDDAFIRMDKMLGFGVSEYADGYPSGKPRYLGPFSLYDAD